MSALIQFSFMSDDLTIALAERITKIRTDQGLTQSQVAKNIGINQQNYSNYEQGIRKVPLKRIPDLAKALNVSTEDLLGFEAKKVRPGPASKLDQRINQLKRLPKKQQQLAIEMIDQIIGNFKKAS